MIRATRAIHPRFVVVLAFFGTHLALAEEAHAQQGLGGTAQADAGRTGTNLARPDELKNLEKTLADESAALSTSDCATACRALASIRRAAEKICALDPDERCDVARAKAEDATRRVHDACPECAIASARAPKAPPHDRAASKGGTRPATDAPEQVVVSGNSPAAPARSESGGRGGCASCTTGGTPPVGDLASGALAIAALALVLRRKRVTPSA